MDSTLPGETISISSIRLAGTRSLALSRATAVSFTLRMLTYLAETSFLRWSQAMLTIRGICMANMITIAQTVIDFTVTCATWNKAT